MRDAARSSRLVPTLLLVPLLAGVTVAHGGGSEPGESTVHKFHVTYGRMVVEGRTVACELRFYRHDLEEALATFGNSPDFRLSPEPRVDSLFLAYLGGKFDVAVEGTKLAAGLIGSGEETDGRDTMWWYAIQYQAEGEIRSLEVTSRLLFELFDDQRNIMKLLHLPSERQETFYFVPDSNSGRVIFGA